MNSPFAYVCSPFAGEVKNNMKKAKTYSRRLYELGYLPIAPHLLFPQFMDDDIPSERKDAMDMASDKGTVLLSIRFSFLQSYFI